MEKLRERWIQWMRGKEEEAIRLRGEISEKTQGMRKTEKRRGNIEEARKELRIARRIYKNKETVGKGILV